MKRRSFLTSVGTAAFTGCSSSGIGSTPTAKVKTVYKTPEDYISEEEYDELKQKYTRLQDRYNQLKNEFHELEKNSVDEDQYEQLQERYEELQDDYRNLQEEARKGVYPPYVISEERHFEIAFNALDGETLYYTVTSDTLESQINTGTFMRHFSISQLSYLGWESIIDRFEGNTKYRKLGNFGTYYQLNPFVVKSNFKTIADDLYSRQTNNYDRMREVWNFVTQLNVYSKEIQETPRMPLETLLLGGGDCEDTTILAASVFAAMDVDWTIQFVYMDIDNPTSVQEINHTVVWVNAGEDRQYIETTSNVEMMPTSYSDGVDGFYVDVTGPS